MEKKCYLTLLSTENYLKGVIALKNSLAKVESKFPLYCMVSENIRPFIKNILHENGVETIDVSPLAVREEIKNSVKNANFLHWNNCWDKLNMFNLTQFDKFVYLDSDMIVLKNIDELFDKPNLTASSDGMFAFNSIVRGKQLNSGLMVIEPSEKTFKELLNYINNLDIKDNGCQDQMVLQGFFSDWGEREELHLSESYNLWATYVNRYPDEIVSDCKVLHYIGAKKPYMSDEYYRGELMPLYANYMQYIKDFDDKKKLLSIIIPQYSETEQQMKTLFETLNNQQNVDFSKFNVVICNDHSDTVISQEFLSQFKNLDIISLRTPQNCGSGSCRQYAIDNTNSEWLWFIDADDMVLSLLSVATVIGKIETTPNIDLIQGYFLQEFYNKETKTYFYQRQNAVTWVHSKIYSRDFLDKYEIKFPKELRVNEDSYFNAMVYNSQARFVKLDNDLTIWKFNKNSLTRKNEGELFITGYLDFIKAKTLFLKDIKNKVSTELYNTLVIQECCYFYFDLQKNEWDKYDNKELKDEINKALLEFYLAQKDIVKKATQEQFNKIYQRIRLTSFNFENYREKMSFDEFYNKLSEKYF